MPETNTPPTTVPATPPATEPTSAPAEDPRTFKQLQQELIDRDFVGADLLTTKGQALAVLKSLDKQNAPANPSNTPTVIDPIRDDSKKDDKVYAGKAAAMKERLDAQPKVRFLIPLGIGERKGAIETVQMNGYRLNILKGVLVDLPEQVAELLAESYQLTAEAGSDFLADRESRRDDSPYKTVAEALE